MNTDNNSSNTTQRHSAQQVAEQHNNCCVIDVRSGAEVNELHLPGSIHIPVNEIPPERVRLALHEAGKAGQPVYLLCQSGKRADIAANTLAGKIDETLIIAEGGVNALKDTNAPLVSGNTNVISLERQVRIGAGALVFVGVLAGYFINPVFFALSGFVGAGLMFAGISGTCAMGLLIAKMPWNK
ncbi:rhodanese-like domain-containing protein [Gilvimarinus polysaccharolyticus]|uniref:rhodanese-like domain-containing protein n=1 Tax=Gilvimarinus polysaccharolyticus TaxID=863921 RepID=UPI00067326A2|nr:rhodanese-like domain-containing protein [Gilvimarinus polysaccharolyticus]